MDCQICDIMFSSWTYNSSVLTMDTRHDHIDLTDFKTNEQWEILYTKSVNQTHLQYQKAKPFLFL